MFDMDSRVGSTNLFQRRQKHLFDGIRVADADLVVGQAYKMAVFLMGLDELLVLVSVKGNAHVP